jgi:DNA-binding SARP family transcriptional activator
MLRVSLLGQFRIAFDGYAPSAKVTHTSQALLAYLLLHRHRSHPRDSLVGLFWADYSQERARSCLNTALWRLRQVLESNGTPRGTYLLTTFTGEVGFNPDSDYWLDAAAFEAQTRPILAMRSEAMVAADAQVLENALQLYTGELLEGFYDDWALHERERMRRLYLNSLAHLMHHYKHQKAYPQSLVYARLILDQDPIREEIHREMMRLYLANGQRVLAIRQYELCCELLAKELGIPPMEETRALHAEIVNGMDPQPTRVIAPHASIDYPNIVQELRQAIEGFEAARSQLQRAIQLVERLADAPARDIMSE